LEVINNGNVGIGTTTPVVKLDVNGSISSQGLAGEATTTTSFPAATGGGTSVTGYTIDSSITVGSGFNGTIGVFQPTVPGCYLITGNAYSGVSSGWVLSICKNTTCNRGGGGVGVVGNGIIADISKVVYLNGSSDTVVLKILNYNGTPATIADVNITWTKLP